MSAIRRAGYRSATNDRRRALAISHHDDYLPGLVGEVLADHGVELVLRAREDDHAYPDPRDIDLVVPFGSVWSVHDPDLERHVAAEQAFLRACDAAGTPVFGVCFGAQQLAAALGGAVHRLTTPEIGWYEVRTTAPELVGAGLDKRRAQIREQAHPHLPPDD